MCIPPDRPAFRFAIVTVGLVALAGVTLSAGEPVDAGRRPLRSHLQPVSEVVAPVGIEGTGLRLSRASTVLRQQLALERGAGLVVDAVAEDSPAARSGFLPNDVLVRIDDQLLVLPEQFDALLESVPPGTVSECLVLRGGRPLIVSLGDAPADAETARTEPRPLRPAASTLALLPGNQPPASTRPSAPLPPVSRRLAMPSGAATETLLRQDADYQIRLTGGDETRLTVTDRQGRMVFNDCIDTPEARGRMPEAIRDRVAHMERLLEPGPDRHASDTRDTRLPIEIGRLDVPPLEIR
jgi:hypothetical protein